jgi:hypothetical protein
VYQGDNFTLISDLTRAFNGLGAEQDRAKQDNVMSALNDKINEYTQARAAEQAAARGNPSVNLGSGGGENVREGIEVTPAPSGDE